MTALEQETVPPVTLDSPVGDLWPRKGRSQLAGQALNCLLLAGIGTVGALTGRTPAALLAIESFGGGCLAEVRRVLPPGLSLSGDGESSPRSLGGEPLPRQEAAEAARRMREARKAAGLTQLELARRTGVSQCWVSQRESGATRMTPEELAAVLAVTGDGEAGDERA